MAFIIIDVQSKNLFPRSPVRQFASQSRYHSSLSIHAEVVLLSLWFAETTALASDSLWFSIRHAFEAYTSSRIVNIKFPPHSPVPMNDNDPSPLN
ncbi:hypothetical protein DID88_008867 [Monilinia fructigena]|uniref:Uncharacterized protein n=1 Tax=Monilinia fructigena TaxID=38457 RepID=A0A395J6P9_9HELO|nr:hypothetical protein DID88_008867 [Monilinia fructigena]